MIKPTQADIGRVVLYLGNTYPGGKVERGVITSFNDHTVFVRYYRDIHSKGTSPQDLKWETARAQEIDPQQPGDPTNPFQRRNSEIYDWESKAYKRAQELDPK